MLKLPLRLKNCKKHVTLIDFCEKTFPLFWKINNRYWEELHFLAFTAARKKFMGTENGRWVKPIEK